MTPATSTAAEARSPVPVTLPTPPTRLARIISTASSPEASLNTLAPLIETDPALSASLMGLANSSLLGGRPPRSARQAALLLGLRAVRNLAVSHAVRSTGGRLDVGELDLDRFWENSLRRAVAASVLAGEAGYHDPTEAFTVGLIQDLGCLALAIQMKEVSGELQAASTLPGDRRLEEERRLTGTSHPEVFRAVGADWGLPDELIELVARHHGGDPVADARDERLRSVIHAADVVADVVQAEGHLEAVQAATAVLARMETAEPLDLESVLGRVSDRMCDVAAEMAIDIGPQPSYQELLSQAQEALISINSGYEELTRQLQESNERLAEANRKLREAMKQKQALAQRLRKSNEILRQLAAVDPLTGIANRRAFIEILDERRAEAARSGEDLSLVLLDIDHFKRVNDLYGHITGDDVLRWLCQRMSGVLRGSDLLGRLGGEEFGVVVSGADETLGRQVAERLRQAVSSRPMGARDGTSFTLTASFGGVTVRGSELPDVEAMLETADAALYASKEAGRNRVTWSRSPAAGSGATPRPMEAAGSR